MSDEATGDDKRDGERRRTIKSGLVWFNSNQTVLTCQVRDLSATGAKIRFLKDHERYLSFNTQSPPDRVTLQLPEGENPGVSLWAETVWVSGKDVGLRFIEGVRYTGPPFSTTG